MAIEPDPHLVAGESPAAAELRAKGPNWLLGRAGERPSIALIVGVSAGFWLTVFLVDLFDWEAGPARALVLLFVAGMVAIVRPLARGKPRATPEGARRLVGPLAAVCSVLLVVAHIEVFVEMLAHPYMNDIGATTMTAGEALARGGNPYRERIDPAPESMPGLQHLTGFKYMPMMAILYLPLNAILRERGTLTTNMILDLLTAFLVFRLAQRGGGKAAGLFALMMYLMVPLVPHEVLVVNVTDLAPVAPLVLAALLADRRPAWAGFCAGLSISTKLLPGMVALPCFLPQHNRWRYAAGAAIGLSPILVFLVISPGPFVSNTVIFSAVRPADSTSWLGILPRDLALVARLAFAVMWTCYAAWEFTHTTDRSPADRCGFASLCIIGLLLIAPINHRNYQLWWLPFVAALLGSAVMKSNHGREGRTTVPVASDLLICEQMYTSWCETYPLAEREVG